MNIFGGSKQMKAVVVPKANAVWELQDRPRPEAGPGQVLVRIRACAICGTDRSKPRRKA